MRIANGDTARHIYFVAVDATDGKSRESSLTSPTVWYSIDGGAKVDMTTPTVSHINNGVWKLAVDEAGMVAVPTGKDECEVLVEIAATEMQTVSRVFEVFRPKVTEGETATAASGVVSADAVKLSGDATAADNLETACDGGTYNLGGGGIALSATGLDSISQSATGMVEIAKAVWDRVLTAATHNVASSAGRRLRTADVITIDSGTAQAGGVDSITLATSAPATAGLLVGCLVVIESGTGAGQSRYFVGYTSGRVGYVARHWTVPPDNTSTYAVYADNQVLFVHMGIAQSGGASTITLQSTASSVNDIYVGQAIRVLSGTGDDQVRIITAYNGTTKVATVDRPWATQPDSTSYYGTMTFGPGLVQAATEVKTVTDKLNSMVELDGAGPAYQYTAAALDQAPGGVTPQQMRDAMKLAPSAGAPAAGSIDKVLSDMPDAIMANDDAVIAPANGPMSLAQWCTNVSEMIAVGRMIALDLNSGDVRPLIVSVEMLSGSPPPADLNLRISEGKVDAGGLGDIVHLQYWDGAQWVVHPEHDPLSQDYKPVMSHGVFVIHMDTPTTQWDGGLWKITYTGRKAVTSHIINVPGMATTGDGAYVWFSPDGAGFSMAQPYSALSPSAQNIDAWRTAVHDLATETNVNDIPTADAATPALAAQTAAEAVKGYIESMTTGGFGSEFTADALINAPTGSGLTPQEVRDAMKLAPTFGGVDAGSVDDLLRIAQDASIHGLIGTQRVLMQQRLSAAGWKFPADGHPLTSVEFSGTIPPGSKIYLCYHVGAVGTGEVTPGSPQWSPLWHQYIGIIESDGWHPYTYAQMRQLWLDLFGVELSEWESGSNQMPTLKMYNDGPIGAGTLTLVLGHAYWGPVPRTYTLEVPEIGAEEMSYVYWDKSGRVIEQAPEQQPDLTSIVAKQSTLTQLLQTSTIVPPANGLREKAARRIVRGDESTQVFVLGEDLTGRVAKFCMKRRRSDTNAQAIVPPTSMTINDVSTGEVQITLTSTQTAVSAPYVWDIQTEDVGTGAHIRTLREGDIVVTEDVGK